MALHHVADGLYLASIPIIALLQTWFEPWAGILVYASHLGDPRTAAFFLFPIAYGLSAHLGLKVLWAATLSEWTNLILKWCLMGHRPYWWVGETTLAHDLPPLDQYSVTCETGPGSPSGHLMTTAAVWYVIITDIVSVILPKIPDDRSLWIWLLQRVPWLLLTLTLTLLSISRIFVATHFPHQCLLGATLGLLLGVFISRRTFLSFTKRWYLLTGVLFLALPFPLVMALKAIYGQLNMDWSLHLAFKWCKFQEWVHPDTTPYASIIRSACLLLGAAIANRFIKWSPVRSFPLNDSPTVFYRCISALLGLCAGFSYSLLQSLVPRPPAFHSTELSRQVILFYSASGFLAVGFTLCVLCLVPQLAVFLSGGRRRRPF